MNFSKSLILSFLVFSSALGYAQDTKLFPFTFKTHPPQTSQFMDTDTSNQLVSIVESRQMLDRVVDLVYHTDCSDKGEVLFWLDWHPEYIQDLENGLTSKNYAVTVISKNLKDDIAVYAFSAVADQKLVGFWYLRKVSYGGKQILATTQFVWCNPSK